MSSKDDWIPRKESEFDAKFKKYCQIVTQKTTGSTPAWTHIPAARVTGLYTLYADWYTAWTKLNSPHTPGDDIRAVAGGVDDPRSDWGTRIHFGILDPANSGGKHRIAAPPHSVFTHKKKYRFDFDGDSGKTVYFSLKYENEKGGEDGEGPFGPIIQAVIP